MKTNHKKIGIIILGMFMLNLTSSAFAQVLTGTMLTGSSMSGAVSTGTENDEPLLVSQESEGNSDYVVSNISDFSFSGLNLTGMILSGANQQKKEYSDDKDNDEVVDNLTNPKLKKTASSIEGFRDHKMDIVNNIYKNTNFGALMDVQEAGKQLQTLTKEFQDINSDFETLQQRKDKVDERYTQVKNGIKQILLTIKDTKEVIEKRIQKIHSYTKKLVNLKKDMANLEEDIEITKQNLVKYTNLLYKINNDYYGTDLNIDDIKLLTKSNNIAQTLSNEDVIKALTVKLDELLGIMKERQESFVEFSEQLNEIRVKYKTEVDNYNSEIQMLTQQKKYLVDLLKYIREDKVMVDDQYENMFENQKNIKEQITNLMDMSKNKMNELDPSTNYKVDVSPLLKLKDQDDSERYFSWPVLPVSRITTFFDDESYKRQFGVYHKGLDLRSPQGANVYAPANGLVYKVVNNDSVALNRIIVIHKYGYITVYLHMNDILVKEGEFVKRGELIGLSGGQPGTRGAGLLTTGPHLHYEIIKNGEYVDPVLVTDLSVIKSNKLLMTQYHAKYEKDKTARQIPLDGIDFMEGDTLNERRKAFLSKYAAGPYSNPALWIDAAKGTNIDVDMGICIGFSETGLGKHFASTRNIGNVGNNDRGDRRGFDSPLAGATAVYKGLMNKYLSRHHTIDQLSRFGNSDGPIYASSPINWEKNMVKCLSKIKGYRVPENYPFRVYNPNLDN